MKKIAMVGALAALCISGGYAAAQQNPAADTTRINKQAVGSILQDTRKDIKAVVGPGGARSLTAEQRAEIRAIITSARTQLIAAGATRQQLQTIRAALKTRLALLHH
jgi:hypothetical protein